jgi:glycosyltransferase involved in cell wall biosynthesis
LRLLFIVPAYNEAASLPLAVQDIFACFPAAEVAVVNDGSTDATAEVARQFPVHLLNLPYNLGIGGAVQTGLLFANREGYEIAVQFDGDGQHPADQVGKLLDVLAEPGVDVVIGSRFLTALGYRAPFLRRLGIAVFRVVLSRVVGQRITDGTSGFRAYTQPAIAFLARNYPHDYPEPESVVTLCRQGFTVREVAVQMRERQGGRSSITAHRSVYYMAKVLLAILVGASRKSVQRSTL